MGVKICSSFTLRPEEHQADRRNGSNLQTVTYLPPSKKTDLYPVLQCFYFAILSSRTKLDTVFDVFFEFARYDQLVILPVLLFYKSSDSPSPIYAFPLLSLPIVAILKLPHLQFL